jgi:ABC-type uncharacterized transport system permease subunit
MRAFFAHSNSGTVLNRAFRNWLPVVAYLSVGLLSILLAVSLGDLDNALAYFNPLAQLISAGIPLGENLAGATQQAGLFSRLALLSLFFIVAFRAGYISLGFEGSLMVAIVLMTLAVYYVQGMGGATIGVLIGALLSSLLLFLLFRRMIKSFYDGTIDDVTPGVVLNIAAITLAGLALRATGLFAGGKQSVASSSVILAADLGSAERSAWLACAFFWITLAAAGGAAAMLRLTNFGLLLRAVGSNRGAARAAGVEFTRVAAGVALVSAGLICVAGIIQFLMIGGVDTEKVRALVVDVLTVSLLAQTRPAFVPIAALCVMGLNEVRIGLQVQGLPMESVFLLQGTLIVAFSLAVSRGLPRA